MKFLILIIVLSASLIISLSASTETHKISNEQNGFVLVELFTSEGCSSCPRADIIAEEVQKQYDDKNVLVLGFHVDYWDKLGWKDIFSNTMFTERQEYYSKVFGLNSIYTPQVVVNGETEFNGSDKNKLISNIEKQLKQKPVSSIELKVVKNNSGKIDVSYSSEAGGSKNEELIIALVQKMATNKIKRGENEGRTLHHINIVREISYLHLTSKETTATFTLSPGLNKEDVFVAGFIQDKRSGKVIAMASASIQ